MRACGASRALDGRVFTLGAGGAGRTRGARNSRCRARGSSWACRARNNGARPGRTGCARRTCCARGSSRTRDDGALACWTRRTSITCRTCRTCGAGRACQLSSVDPLQAIERPKVSGGFVQHAVAAHGLRESGRKRGLRVDAHGGQRTDDGRGRSNRAGGANQASVGKVLVRRDAIANLELVRVRFQYQLAVGQDGVELQPASSGVAAQGELNDRRTETHDCALPRSSLAPPV